MCVRVNSHDIHWDRGGQALTDVFEEVIGGEEVGAPWDQVLLELQQLSTPTQKHLTHTHTHTLKPECVCSFLIFPSLWLFFFFNINSSLIRDTTLQFPLFT